MAPHGSFLRCPLSPSAVGPERGQSMKGGREHLLTLHTALPQRWPWTPPLLRVLLLRGLGRVGPPTARFCQHGPTRGKFSDTSPHAESGDRKWGLGPSGFCTGPWPESGQIPTPHPVTGLDTCPTLEAERQDTPISDTFQHLPQGCHSNGPC